jgi:hypothetical protein
MPRFGTKSLLIGFAVAALWLSTFTGYAPASDVRKSILLLTLITSGIVAIYGRGQWRAFWSAFCVVMLLCGGLNLNEPLNRYVPDFFWLEVSELPQPPDPTLFGTPSSPSTVTPYVMPAPPAATPPTFSGPPLIAPQVLVPGTSMREALKHTYIAASIIGLATAAGFIAAYIHTQSRKSVPNRDNS